MKLAERMLNIKPSPIMEVAAKARTLREQGVSVLDLSVGEPDFETADAIKKAAINAIERGETKYPPVPGTRLLRQTVAQFATSLYHLDVAVENVAISCGCKQALFNAMFALLNPQDEVLVSTPYWASYPDMVELTGARFIPVRNRQKLGPLATAADFAAQITPKTKMLLLNSPNNPTGSIYSRAMLEDIAALLRQHPQLVVISDDIYYGLVFDDDFHSLLHVAPELRSRVVVVSGASKTYAMTGWRIGIAIGPPALITAMSDMQGVSTSGACSIAQAAAVCAFANQTLEHTAMMRNAFKERRTHILNCLQAIPNITTLYPDGAFYVFIDVQNYLQVNHPTTTALCTYLLESVYLAAVPGDAFGAPGFIRLSYACSDKEITAGVSRLRQGLAALSN